MQAAEDHQIQAQIRLIDAQARSQRGFPALPIVRGKGQAHG
jgi:hypothetical protein